MIPSARNTEDHIGVPIRLDGKLHTRTENHLRLTFKLIVNGPEMRADSRVIPNFVSSPIAFFIPLDESRKAVNGNFISRANILVRNQRTNIRIIRLIVYREIEHRRIERESRRIDYFPLYHAVADVFTAVFESPFNLTRAELVETFHFGICDEDVQIVARVIELRPDAAAKDDVTQSFRTQISVHLAEERSEEHTSELQSREN